MIKLTDIFSKKKRSEIMSKVKSVNTKPELKLRKALFSKGLRYRIHFKINGKPDIAFSRKKLAIFVDGCFWHCCPKHCRMPKSNKSYWHSKIKRNILNAEEKDKMLKAQGWKILHIWEHEINENLGKAANKVLSRIE